LRACQANVAQQVIVELSQLLRANAPTRAVPPRSFIFSRAHAWRVQPAHPFLRSPQQVLGRDQLLAATRIHDDEVYDRSVDVQILRLRRKLEANPSAPELIKIERGAGYVFTAPVQVV
jgi:Transcriptional regulatory protein, C terminal